MQLLSLCAVWACKRMPACSISLHGCRGRLVWLCWCPLTLTRRGSALWQTDRAKAGRSCDRIPLCLLSCFTLSINRHLQAALLSGQQKRSLALCSVVSLSPTLCFLGICHGNAA